MAVPPQSASRVEVLRLPAGASEWDELAVEEPLEIRVNGASVAVTMRNWRTVQKLNEMVQE